MTDIASRLNSLNIINKEKKLKIQGYFLKLQNSKDFFLVQRHGICIKDILGCSYVMLERIQIENEVLILCNKCMDKRPISCVSHLRKSDLESLKQQSCEHALVSYLLFDQEKLLSVGMAHNEDEDSVEVLAVQKDYVAVIHPSKKNKKNYSAAVRLSNRMNAPKCCQCKGTDLCVHLRIHKETYKKQQSNINHNETSTSNDINDAATASTSKEGDDENTVYEGKHCI